MRHHRFFLEYLMNHAGGSRILAMAMAIWLSLMGVCLAQSQQCWTFINGVWTYNPACSQTPNTPLKVAVGKQLTVNNTLTLSGQDNAGLNIGAGGTLGSAAYASTQSFQPAGGALNLVGIDTTTSVANGTSTSCSSGQKTWSALFPSGLGFTSGMMVTAYETANPATYMQGTVCSYSGTTLTISSTYSQGTFTGTGWTIQISGPQGPQGAQGTSAVPVGTAEFGFYASLPTNYLWASGSSYTACVSKTTYSGLYTAVGDVATTANSCTTGNFGIPNMSGRFPLGTGTGNTANNGGSGTTRTLGQMSGGDPNVSGSAAPYGAETHTQITAELAQHSHTITDPGHQHESPDGHQFLTWQGSGNGLAGGGFAFGNPSAYTLTAYTGISINNTGSSSPMSIMPPWIAGNWIIRYQ